MADWINFENTDAVDNLSTHEVCNSLEEFNLKFKRHIENANNSLLPQLLSIQLDIGFGGTFNIPVDLLSTSLAFPVVQLDTTDPKNIILPPEKRRRLEASATETAYQSMNVLEILLAQPENKPIPIEREVAKEIMASVTEIDGYGWRCHNIFKTKRDGWRLEYICIDSYQNQHRASNRVRRKEASEEETTDHKKEKRQVHRSVESRKELRKQKSRSKRRSTANIDPITTSETVSNHNASSAKSPIHGLQASLNLLSQQEAGVDKASLTENPPHQTTANDVIRARTLSTQNSSFDSSVQSTIASPRRSPQTDAIVTVLEQAHCGPSMNFSINQTHAMSLLGAAGIDFKSLSDYQMMVFQDQEPDVQLISLKLFQEYGPANLMAKLYDVSYTDNVWNIHDPLPSHQNSTNSLSHLPIEHNVDVSGEWSLPESSVHNQNASVNLYDSRNASQRTLTAPPIDVESLNSRNEERPSTPGHIPNFDVQDQLENDQEVDALTGFDDDTRGGILSESIATIEGLTANGTPKQPGVFEYRNMVKPAHEKSHLKRVRSIDTSANVPNANNKTKKRTRAGCRTCGEMRMKYDRGHQTCNNCSEGNKECICVLAPPRKSRNVWDDTIEATSQNDQAFQHTNDITNDDDYEISDDTWLQDLIAASLGMD